MQEFDPGQGRILFALWQGDGITITQLAERTALQKSTLTRMLDRLEHADLLRREPDPADRRTTRVLLTGQAKSALHTFAEVSEQMRDLFYRGFTQPEIEAFESALERIFTNLTNPAGRDPLTPAGHPDQRPVSRGPSSAPGR
jgi:DNA-binding MarR family transcriptional regulator